LTLRKNDIYKQIANSGDATSPLLNVREARLSFEGREALRAAGKKLDRNTLDMSSKTFIGWDGEGITQDLSPEEIGRGIKHKAQDYVLFGASTGDYVISDSLNTQTCLNLMLKVKSQNPHSEMVGFAIGYDAEMIMRDFTPAQLERIHKHGVVRWRDYRIEYRPKKWFQVSGNYGGRKVVCKIWDVWSFFTCSFVRALEQYLPDLDKSQLDVVISGKGQRGSFTVERLRNEVVPYWRTELELLVRLMDRLRELMNQKGLHPRGWHGPGALANAVNVKYRTSRAMNRDLLEGVLNASQFGYAAGRVEQFKVGRAGETVYKYDLNSAYPAAMLELPSLNGTWSYREAEHIADVRMYGMYFVEYVGINHVASALPHPFFHRTKDGYITFPRITIGWYWGPEVLSALYLNEVHNEIVVRVRAAWEMDTSTSYYPFLWLQEMYDERLELKRRGEQAQLVLKLAMNSMYGKMAQRTGYNEKTKQIPKYHQYEWAGYVTSRTRARLYKAALLAAEHGALIGIETDAVFSTIPLPLSTSTNLGDWGLETFDDCVYLQTGVYWLLENGDWKAKFRGMDKDTLTLDMALKYLQTTSLNVEEIHDYQRNAMQGMTRTRFVGSKAAMHVNRLEDWRVWKTDPVKLMVGLSYKRVHVPEMCTVCSRGDYFAHDRMHGMITGVNGMGASHATKIPWRNVAGEATLWEEEAQIDPSFVRA
jgi:hypothetical protein